MTDKTYDVTAIGNAIVDVIAHADEDLLARHGLTKGSMVLVDDQVARKLYDEMGPAVEVSGGSAANTAVGLASFGGRASFSGRVADDVLGDVFTHDIRAAGVHFDPPPTAPNPRGSADVIGGDLGTGRCLVLVTPDAQRTMSTFLGVAGSLATEHVDLEAVASSKVVYCEGYLWDQPSAKAALRAAMETARASGTKVAFTLSDSFCVDRHRSEFLDLAQNHIDILFANEAELMSLYEATSWEEAAAAVAGHCEIACLTRSEQGSVIVTDDGERLAIESVHFGRVVDTTGAGDLYAAGFLHGYTRGLGLAMAGRLGSLAAGEVIGHVGARPETPLGELAATLG